MHTDAHRLKWEKICVNLCESVVQSSKSFPLWLTNTVMSQFFTTKIAEFAGLHFITVKSNALHRRADITVFTPHIDPLPAELPLVILLHGVYGSHWDWAVKGQAHATAQRLMDTGQIKPMILAMPSDGLYGDGSGYVPHREDNYEQWIVEDVPQVLREQFPVLNAQTPIFIAGLSMGGFGALRLGAKYPQAFKAFSGLSSITHFDQLSQFVSSFDTLKNDAIEQDGVLDWLMKNRDQLPPFRFDCGSDDILIDANRQLHAALIAQKIPHTYEEFPGVHEWAYWERNLGHTLRFFNQFID